MKQLKNLWRGLLGDFLVLLFMMVITIVAEVIISLIKGLPLLTI